MKKNLFKGVNRIITHLNCPDGMASAILLYDALKIEPEFYVHGMDSFQHLKVTPKTLFCDICPPAHLVDQFVATGGIVLDHHKAAQSSVVKFGERGVFADEKLAPGVSGAYLAFNEVWRPAMLQGISVRHSLAENFVRLVGIRDTWQRQSKDWEIACHQAAALIFYPWKYWKSQVDRNGHDGDTQYLALTDEMVVGKLIHENRLIKAQQCAEDALISDIHGLRVAVFNDSDKLTSDVAELLRQEGINIIVGFSYYKSNIDMKFPVLSYNLRSDGSFDVAQFSTVFDGGGHTKAAGYTKTICKNADPYSIILNDLDTYIKHDIYP